MIEPDSLVVNPSDEIVDLRRRILQLDEQILGHICQRGRLVKEVQKLRAEHFRTRPGERDPDRETALLHHLLPLNQGPYPDETITQIWEAFFGATIVQR